MKNKPDPDIEAVGSGPTAGAPRDILASRNLNKHWMRGDCAAIAFAIATGKAP